MLDDMTGNYGIQRAIAYWAQTLDIDIEVELGFRTTRRAHQFRPICVSIETTRTLTFGTGWPSGDVTCPVIMSVVTPTCARITAGMRASAAIQK